MRNSESIEANLEELHGSQQQDEQREAKTERIKPWRWKKGQSGNPGGRKKDDLAAEIAQAVFEQNKELMYQSMAKMLRKGSAFGFQVLADRAYGKLSDNVNLNIETSLAEKLEKVRKRKAGK